MLLKKLYESEKEEKLVIQQEVNIKFDLSRVKSKELLIILAFEQAQFALVSKEPTDAEIVKYIGDKLTNEKK